MAVLPPVKTTYLPELHDGRDGLPQTIKVVNQLLRRANAAPPIQPVPPWLTHSVQYISPTAADNTGDGLSWPTAKKTGAAGYLTLGGSGGTLIFAPGSIWSDGTEAPGLTAGQGCWLADSPTASGVMPPGFLPHYPTEFRVQGLSFVAPLGYQAGLLLFGPQTVQTNRRSPSIWIVASGNPARFIDVAIESQLPARIGWDYRRKSADLTPAFASVTNAVRTGGLTTLTVSFPTPWSIATMSRAANITTVTWNANDLPSAHAGCWVTIVSGDVRFPSGSYQALASPAPVLTGTTYSVSYSDPGADVATVIVPGTAAGHMCQTKDIIDLESTDANFPGTMYEVSSVTATTVVVKDSYGANHAAGNIGQYCLQLRNLYASTTFDYWENCVLQCTADSDQFRACSAPAMDRGSSTGNEAWTFIRGGYYCGAQFDSFVSPGTPGIPDLNRGASIFGSGGSFGRAIISGDKFSTESGNVRLVGSVDNAWGALISDYTFEASGQVQCPSPVTFDALGASGAYIRLSNCSIADAPNQPEAVDLGFASGQIYIEGCDRVINSPSLSDHVTQAVSLNQRLTWGNTSATQSMEALGLVGPWGNDGRIAGKRDDEQSNFGVYQGRASVTNRVPSDLTAWTADAGVTVTGGQATDDGGAAGYLIGGASGNLTFNVAVAASVAGDHFVFGVWKKGIIPSPPAFVGFQYTGAPNRYGLYTPFYGKAKDWDWWTFIAVAQASDAGFVNLQVQIQHQAGADFTVYMPTLLALPLATYTDNEAYRIYRTFKAPPSYLRAGEVGTMTGQPFYAHGGVGVDASVLTVPSGADTQTKNLPLRKASDGTVQGYIPVIPTDKILSASLAPVAANTIVANPTASSAVPTTMALGTTSGVLQYVNGTPDTIAVYAAGSNRIACGSGTSGQLKDYATFTYDGTTLAVSSVVAINGASAPASASLVVGNTTDTDRDRVKLLVGGGSLGPTGASDSTLLDVNPSATTIKLGVGVAGGIYATQRIRSLTYPGGGLGCSVVVAASLYIDAAPTLVVASGQPYALYIASGLAYVAGALDSGSTITGHALAAIGTAGTAFVANGDSGPIVGFFGASPLGQQTGGVASAGATYTATEQGMLNRAYAALRAYGLLT